MTEAAPRDGSYPGEPPQLCPARRSLPASAYTLGILCQGWVVVSQEGTCGGDCGTEVVVSKPGAHPDRFISGL